MFLIPKIRKNKTKTVAIIPPLTLKKEFLTPKSAILHQLILILQLTYILQQIL